MLEIPIEMISFLTQQWNLKAELKGSEWHHQRWKIFKNAFRQNIKKQNETKKKTVKCKRHISGDVGLMAFDKDSQSPFLQFFFWTSFLRGLKWIWHQRFICCWVCEGIRRCRLMALNDLIVDVIDWRRVDMRAGRLVSTLSCSLWL